MNPAGFHLRSQVCRSALTSLNYSSLHCTCPSATSDCVMCTLLCEHVCVCVCVCVWLLVRWAAWHLQYYFRDQHLTEASARPAAGCQTWYLQQRFTAANGELLALAADSQRTAAAQWQAHYTLYCRQLTLHKISILKSFCPVSLYCNSESWCLLSWGNRGSTRTACGHGRCVSVCVCVCVCEIKSLFPVEEQLIVCLSSSDVELGPLMPDRTRFISSTTGCLC